MKSFFMHMTQGDLAFMNRDYLMLCHCEVIAGEMCLHFSAQRTGRDETTTGMPLVFCRHKIQVVHCTLWLNESPNPPQTLLHPTQTNMAGCQVHKSSLNNACCVTHVNTKTCEHVCMHAYTDTQPLSGKPTSWKGAESRLREGRDENVSHILPFYFHMNHRAELCKCVCFNLFDCIGACTSVCVCV